MRKKVIVGCAVAGLAMFAGLRIWLSPPTEPRFEGKTASAWFELYVMQGVGASRHDGIASIEGLEALRIMGSNAVLTLVSEGFDPKPPPPTTPVLDPVRRLLGVRVYQAETPEHRRLQAVEAMRIVRPSGNFLLPLLTNALAQTGTTNSRQALMFLGAIDNDDPSAVFHLTNALLSPDSWSRALAAQSLRWASPRTPSALPMLLAEIESPATLLGLPDLLLAVANYGEAVSNAVPALRRHLSNTNESCRIAAALAVDHINPGDPDAWKVLNELAHGSQRGSSGSQFNFISGFTTKIDLRRHRFVPWLIGLSVERATLLNQRDLWALSEIDAQEAANALRECMTAKNRTPYEQIWAAGQILRGDPRDSGAIAFLIATLQSPSESRWHSFVIEQLFGVATDQQAAIQALEKFRDDTRGKPAADAQRALRIIHWRSAYTNRVEHSRPVTP